MRSRVARWLIAALLLAVGAGAALQVNFLLAQLHQLAAAQQASLLQLARFDTLAADLFATQSAYVAPGQADSPWIERARELNSELATLLTSIRTSTHAAEAPSTVQMMSDGMSQAALADVSARAYLQQEQDLMAADVVFGESRAAITSARTAAAELGTLESRYFDVERSRVQQRVLLIAGGAGALMAIGLLIMVPLPRPRPEPLTLSSPTMDERPASAPEPPSAPAIDLAAIADLCTSISRIDSSAALPDMLARTATLLDAAGVIVWLAAGNELIAATSHGYDPRLIGRLGAIPRDAENATAAAWRTGEIQTVAGDVMANGAIVAPMFAPDTCIGVLAAEVRHGREHDISARAVTMMIAAQLATILAAWPAPSPTHAAEA